MTDVSDFNKNDLTEIFKIYKKHKNQKKKILEIIKKPNNNFNEILNKFKNKIKLNKNCNEECLFKKIKKSYNKYFFEKNRNEILNNYFSVIEKDKDGKSIYLDNDFDANYGFINYIDTNSKSKNNDLTGGKYCNYKFNVVDMEGDNLNMETMRNELGINAIENSIILIMKIYTQLIDKFQFHNCESDNIYELFEYYGQVRKLNNYYFIKPSLFIKSRDSEPVTRENLVSKYNNDNNISKCAENKFQECFNIINRQVDEFDEQYVNNVDDFLNRINQENYEYTFQDLYIARNYLKRLIQDQFTKFLNNYAVINDNYLQVRRGNFSYINFLMNIKNRLSNYLENFNFTDVREDFLQDYEELIELIDNQDNLQEEIFNRVSIIMKGGNVSKLFMNNFRFDENGDQQIFSINETNQNEQNREHRNYLQDLSDFDFDIKINTNLNNPFRGVQNEGELFVRMQQNKDFLIKELISRKIAFKLIKTFFNEFNMSNVFENEFNDIKNNIKCHIQYFYSLLCHLQINLTKDFYDLHIYYEPDKELDLAEEIEKFSYFKDQNRFEIKKVIETNNNNTPRHEDNLFSLCSYYNLGTLYENQNGEIFLNSFDLTRLMLRLKINISVYTGNKHFTFPVMSKAEVFDFGYSHSNSLLSFALPIVDPKDFNLRIKSPNPNEYYFHNIKIKDYKFILFELLHISIYTTDVKTQKRYERFFKILNNIRNVPNLISVFTDPCYSLIVKYQDHTETFNLLDGIIILISKIYNEYGTNNQFLTRLNRIDAWREIYGQFNNNNINETLYYRYYGQHYYSRNTISTILNLL
jgi:hypothetical protein